MAIHLTVEQEHQLSEIAQTHGLSADQLAHEVLEHYLVRETTHDQQLLDAIAEADRGELIDHEEIVAWTRATLGPS
jgi:predicted transcriptional regulator